jgi:acetylornithine deacetylase
MARLMTREELLGRLVAFDSSSQVSNRAIADFVCNYLDGPGVRIFRNSAPTGDQLNLVIARGPHAGNHGGLTLSGHLDTVPFGEADWETDPLALTRRHGRYYGRGVCDMKGFLALAIEQFAGMKDVELRQPLVLLLTYDEELGTLGARQFVETWTGAEPLPRATVIGEPTSLEVVRLHKGHLKLRVVIRGRAGHSAYPGSGRNAIELAGLVIQRLGELGRCLAREPTADGALFGSVPHATLNLATISGGVALNVIPDRCALELGIRTLPGTTSEELMERVRCAIDEAVKSGQYALELIGDSPPMGTSELAPIHTSLCQLAGQTGSRAVAFASDAGWLRTLDLDCVLWGPGSIQAAHRANEWLPIVELDRAAELVGRLVRNWCGEEPEVSR